MKVKWCGEPIYVDVLREVISSSRPMEYRWSLEWNDYIIEVLKDKCHYPEIFSPILWNPKGGVDVLGTPCKTLPEAIQVCFDNIDYPLMQMNNDEDDYK